MQQNNVGQFGQLRQDPPLEFARVAFDDGDESLRAGVKFAQKVFLGLLMLLTFAVYATVWT